MSLDNNCEIIQAIIQGIRKIGRKEQQDENVESKIINEEETHTHGKDTKSENMQLNGGKEDNNGETMYACSNSAKNMTAVSDKNSYTSSNDNTCQTVSFYSNDTSIQICSYKTKVFRDIRRLRKVNNLFIEDDYIYASDLVGKSGSVLFFSPDFNFLVKTIRKTEKNTLLSLIPKYTEHINKYDKTFLSVYYGCYKIVIERTTIYFIIMNNFLPPQNVHQLYDLKGSFYKRMGKRENSTVLKDLDWRKNRKRIYIEEKAALIDQIEKDVMFLEKNRIMDYSLLLGITGTDKNEFKDCSNSRSDTITRNCLSDRSSQDVRSDVSWINLQNEQNNEKKGIEYRYVTNGNMQSGAQHCFDIDKRSTRGYLSDVKDMNEMYFMGIIDLLTKWNWKKVLEYYFNRFFCKKEFSSVNPKAYRERFINMVKKRIFYEKDSVIIE